MTEHVSHLQVAPSEDGGPKAPIRSIHPVEKRLPAIGSLQISAALRRAATAESGIRQAISLILFMLAPALRFHGSARISTPLRWLAGPGIMIATIALLSALFHMPVRYRTDRVTVDPGVLMLQAIDLLVLPNAARALFPERLIPTSSTIASGLSSSWGPPP